MVLLYGLEVRVLHRILGGDALPMIVPKHLRQEIQGLFRDQVLILSVDELVPGFLRVLP